MFKKIILCFILSCLSFSASSAEKKDLKNIKDNIVNLDESSRQIMATIYTMNKRLKRLSSRRQKTKIKLLAKENQVQNLSKEIVQLEDQLKAQRKLLSRRIRTLYMLGDDKFLQVIFTAQNAEDLNQSLYYLERFAKKDFAMVADFKKNLGTLKSKKESVDKEVRNLLVIKKNLEGNEKNLNARQVEKSKYLSSIGKKRKQALKKLKTIRKEDKQNLAGLLDMSFFEKKGYVPHPISANITRSYGIIEHPEFHYKLIHKGLTYVAAEKSAVKAVFKGRVVHLGDLPTYGKTLILDHGDHYYSLYSGLKKPKVSVGDSIDPQQVLDESVSELYFEIRHFSDAVNPESWLAKEANRDQT